MSIAWVRVVAAVALWSPDNSFRRTCPFRGAAAEPGSWALS